MFIAKAMRVSDKTLHKMKFLSTRLMIFGGAHAHSLSLLARPKEAAFFAYFMVWPSLRTLCTELENSWMPTQKYSVVTGLLLLDCIISNLWWIILEQHYSVNKLFKQCCIGAISVQ